MVDTGADPVTLAEAMRALLAKTQELQAMKADGKTPAELTGLPTGFPSIDRMTGGLKGGQLIIIAARPASPVLGTFRELAKRRLADAALMEMRLNERKQQNEHNQKKGIVNREIIPHLCRNVYPKQCFWVHIAETCTRKRDFGYISDGRRGVAPRTAPMMFQSMDFLPMEAGKCA